MDAEPHRADADKGDDPPEPVGSNALGDLPGAQQGAGDGEEGEGFLPRRHRAVDVQREAQTVEGDEGDGEQDAPLGPPRVVPRDPWVAARSGRVDTAVR